MWHLSDTCLDRFFPTYPFLLTISISQQLSKSNGAYHFMKTALHFALVSLNFLLFCIYPRAKDSLWALLPTDMGWNFTRQTESWFFSSVEFLFVAHAFPSLLNSQQQFSVRAAAALSLFGFFLFFILSSHIELILSWKVLSLHWPGEGETYHKLAELQCTMLWTCKILFKSLHL